MKKLVLFVFCCLLMAVSLAQTGQDTVPREPREQRDTPVSKPVVKPPVKKDTVKDTAAKLPVADTATVTEPVVLPGADSNRPRPAVTPRADSGAIPAASVLKGPPLPSVQPSVAGFQKVLYRHPYFNFYGKAVLITEHLKKSSHDEGLFYFLCAVLFFYGFIRVAFIKYLDNLNTLFFRVTMRQQQIRDQVLQSPLPSLFLNILFVVSSGLFLSIAADYHNFVPGMNRWLLLFYCCVLVATIYLGKFILLKMIGWMFNIRNAADTYIFVVFLVNKMLGIYLLPALLLMAFAHPPFLTVLITLTYFCLAILFIYRFIIAYRPVRNEIKITRFHFFLYLCAFEIAPLLLIYKVLLIFVVRSY